MARAQQSETGWLIFPTAIGSCGVSWCPQGLTRFLLPDTTLTEMRRSLQQASGSAKPAASPPTWIHALVRQVEKHSKGQSQDFSRVPVHLDGVTDFTRSVYTQAQKIPAGEIITYGELATRIGKPGAVRAVGTALGKNALPLIIPCHRIVAAGGKPGGFSSPGGLETKRLLLACEGASLEKPRVLVTAAQWQEGLRHVKRDRQLAALIRQLDDTTFTPRRNAEPLQVFISAIVSQQLSTKVAATILKRVRVLTDRNGQPCAKKMLAADVEALRAAGLSYMKVSYLKDLAQHSVDGSLPSLAQVKQMSDEQLIRCFTAIKGVGRWTVEMYLIFDLGRADVFPVDDYGIRKAIAKLHGLAELPAAKNMTHYGDLWRPYRTVASICLWRSLDS